ncbi:mediator complex subunit [Ascosphaera acerosa]|nr:mediator complex subunit [Ascosphaera acerosa]
MVCRPHRWARSQTAITDAADNTHGGQPGTGAITFDHACLSIEATLRSTIALHSSRLLHAVYRGLCELPAYASGSLYAGLHSFTIEPTDCVLVVQLTAKRTARVTIEPVTGATVLRTAPPLTSTQEGAKLKHMSAAAVVQRLKHLRAAALTEDLHPLLCALRFTPVALPSACVDELRRRIGVPAGAANISALAHPSFGPDWGVVLVNDLNAGDSWWVAHYADTEYAVSNAHLGGHPVHGKRRTVQALHLVTAGFLSLAAPTAPTAPTSASAGPANTASELSHARLAQLHLACLGAAVMHANLGFLDRLGCVLYAPPASQLRVAADLRVPPFSFCYQPSTLPHEMLLRFDASEKPSSAGRPRPCLLRETVQVSFKRYDACARRAVILVHGRLGTARPSLARVSTPQQHARDRRGSGRHHARPAPPQVEFDAAGDHFSMHLTCRVGGTIMPRVLLRLQHLEHMLRLFDMVARRDDTQATAFSLSRIDFVSRPVFAPLSADTGDKMPSARHSATSASSSSDETYRLFVKVRHNTQAITSYAAGGMPLLDPTPSNDMEVALRFGRSRTPPPRSGAAHASKQGIRQSIIFHMSQHDLETGFDATMHLLQAIRPLLEALSAVAEQTPAGPTAPSRTGGEEGAADQQPQSQSYQQSRPSDSEEAAADTAGQQTGIPPTNAVVIPRDAKVYHVRYPSCGHGYSLQLAYVRKTMMWVVRDVSTADQAQRWPALRRDLQCEVFDKKCREWIGLGNGALADAAAIDSLVQAIHRVVMSHGSHAGSQAAPGEAEAQRQRQGQAQMPLTVPLSDHSQPPAASSVGQLQVSPPANDGEAAGRLPETATGPAAMATTTTNTAASGPPAAAPPPPAAARSQQVSDADIILIDDD